MTNRKDYVIISKFLRECWNGRQARLRCVWLCRVGSSPISRTKKSRYPSGYLDFLMPDGTRKAVKKTCQWHVFRPWESPTKSRRIRYGCGLILIICKIQKSWYERFSVDSFKQITPNPNGIWSYFLFMREMGLSHELHLSKKAEPYGSAFPFIGNTYPSPSDN